MRCEVCGYKILGKPYNVTIEGAKLIVCGKCSKHSSQTYEETEPKKREPKKTMKPRKIQSKKDPINAEIELIENFGIKTREAREKMKLSHKELGKKINEKVSVLKKIEMEKMRPNNKLALKLERILNVRLLIASTAEKFPPLSSFKPLNHHERTLGDLIQMNKTRRLQKNESDHNSTSTSL